MDLFQTFLNLVVPCIGLTALLLLWPLLALLRFASRFYRFFFEENVRGKAVLITGASSGIGEQIAYQYAKKGAILVLVGQREARLRVVADRCLKKGAMDVRAIIADASKEADCRKFIEETVNHFGRLDHLVNNVGLCPSFLFEEAFDSTPLHRIMDIDFWGHIYPTYYALPHLKRSNGKIIVNASVTACLPYPRMAIDCAAKAALVSFFDTLRVEMGRSISAITIVKPGWIESEITMGKLLNERGEVELREDKRDVLVGPVPIAYAEESAQAIVTGAVRSKRQVTIPYWYSAFFLYRIFAPEVLDFLSALFFLIPMPGHKDGAPISKSVIDIPGIKAVMYPTSVLTPRPSLKQRKQ